jgi:DNA-binding Lrp family transcriptional regulator
MIQAYILVETSAGATFDVQNSLSEMKKVVVSAHTVTGPYDIIMLVQAKDLKAIGKIVTEEIRHIPGVTRTLTCVVV